MSYEPDRRDASGVVAGVAAAARATATPPSLGGPAATWGPRLFDGESLQDEREPSQALLLAVGRGAAGAVAHLDELPSRARRAFLEDRLGIERLKVVPDRVVVLIEGDPKRLPVTLPKGAQLRAGRGPLGPRVYETQQDSVVLGTPVVGTHTYRVPDDRDTIAHGTEAETPAPHDLIVASDMLRVDSGSATIDLTISGVRFNGSVPASTSQMRSFFLALQWSISSAAAEGWSPLGVDSANSIAQASDRVLLRLTLATPSAPTDVAGRSVYALRASFPASATTGFTLGLAFGLSLGSITLQVRGDDVRPQAGYANDGLLDLTKEFEPFGPVPHRGDAFYIVSEEAYAKPLASLSVALEELDPGGGFTEASYESLQKSDLDKVIYKINKYLEGKTETRVSEKDTGVQVTKAHAPAVRWERRAAGQWTEFESKSEFSSISFGPPGVSGPFSESAELSGSEVRAIRAFLYQGDFGWKAYEQKLAENAKKAASGKGSEMEVVVPPDPPVFSRIRLSYLTASRSNTTNPSMVGVLVRNALAAPLDVTSDPTIEPFVAGDADSSTLYVGLDDAVPLGEVVSLYVDVDAASACGASEEATATFEYDAGDGGWKSLDVVDGTLGLRQSGIVSFVAPLDWNSGSEAVDEEGGRWLRAHATSAALPARVRGVRTDAVEAVYRLASGHEEDDDTPADPLPAGGIKGLAVAIPGIKSLTNPGPSWGGRGPESDQAFFARANGVVRHRKRAVTPWDVEELVRSEFPEVALVRCLPHHSEASDCEPGAISVVVVPNTADRAPVPTVQLAATVRSFIDERATSWLQAVILCPVYEEVSVRTTLKLVPGVAAGDAAKRIEEDLRSFLHPLGPRRRTAGFGRSLFRSELLSFFEHHPLVRFVVDGLLDFEGANAGEERIDVDPCRGLIASAEKHVLTVEATL
jgi:hypothetical protein